MPLPPPGLSEDLSTSRGLPMQIYANVGQEIMDCPASTCASPLPPQVRGVMALTSRCLQNRVQVSLPLEALATDGSLRILGRRHTDEPSQTIPAPHL